MRTVSPLHFFVAAVVLLLSNADVSAQSDNLARYMTKDALTVEDQAQMDVEISDRVSSLREAENSIERRKAARDRLVQTVATSGAKDGPLSYYTERVTYYLKPKLVNEKRVTADDAAMVLRALNHPNTVSAFVIGLGSPYPSTQYQCAAGIRDLQKPIVGNEPLSEEVLDALARCGSKASNPALLRTVYAAADLASASADFKLFDEQVEAYAEIFAARIKQLEQGASNEIDDLPGIRAIAKVAPKASINAKKKLMPSLAAYYQLIAQRYADRNLSDEYLPTFRQFALTVEQCLVAVLQSEQVQPPSDSYRDRLKVKRDGDSVRAVRAAADAMATVLQSEPFKLP